MKLLTKLFILLALIAPLFFTPLALADDSALFTACSANQNTSKSPVCDSAGTKTNPVVHTFRVTADIFAWLAGIAAVILIITSGITMITSGGNSDAVGTARKRIQNALIGLVIIAFAWTIITFAIDKFI